MLLANPHAVRRAYDAGLARLLCRDDARAARRRLASWDLLCARPTPLWSLPGLATSLGIAGLQVKDESTRSPLGSFKALGAPNALLELVRRRHARQAWSAPDLLAGHHAEALRDLVVISATDGNHGRALAAAARSLGCRCVIVLHGRVGAEREAAIAELGARIVRIAGHYDDSVAEAARLARANGWEVVSDTSYAGYDEVPRDVMRGYGVIADELLDSAGEGPDCPWTHVVLQGGVGGFAAAIAGLLWERYRERRPGLLVVEPEQADCLLQSALQGRAARASGSVDSLMAGLACGEASPQAWRWLRHAVDGFITVSDARAADAMRTLAQGAEGDVPIVSGESGAAGLAALRVLAGTPQARQSMGLDSGSRVLVVNTEGATAPGVYAGLVGRDAAAVRAAQRAWLARQGIEQGALMRRIAELAAIGATAGGGVCRLALSDADRQGRDRLVAWMKDLGLAVRVDRIGNIFGTRDGRRGGAPVMIGSHIDSVANGGRYDGSYGVLAGLELVCRLDARHVATARPIVVAAFTNEEGARFQPDMMGSLVHAGGLPLEQALASLDADGARLGDELHRIGYAGDMPCGSIVPHAYVELHIEQGPVMQAEGVEIGVVEDLQGISWQEFTIVGQANHAGTTPMHLRRDAGHCAAAIAVFVRELAARHGGGQLATVGTLRLQPDLVNVIPGRAALSVDLRNTDAAALERAERDLAQFVRRLATEQGVHIESRRLARSDPVRFHPRIVRVIEDCAGLRSPSVRRMTSGAGHDAQMMARICPSAMIFVPSRGGISHNPREHTDAADLKRGADVLLDVVLALAAED